MDTDSEALTQYLDVIRTIPKAQRLMRALALSAVLRDLARGGAVRHSGDLGHDAVVERFLSELYGRDAGRRAAVWLRDSSR